MSRGKHRAAAATRRAHAESHAVADVRAAHEADLRAWAAERTELPAQLADARAIVDVRAAELATDRLAAARDEFERQLDERTRRLREAIDLLVKVSSRADARYSMAELDRLHELTGDAFGKLFPEGGDRWARRSRARDFRRVSAMGQAELAKPPTKRNPRLMPIASGDET